MKSLTILITLFYFTGMKMKYLAMFTTLYYFATIIKIKYVTTLNQLLYFSDVKMIYLTVFTTLFYFTAIKIESLNTFTLLFCVTTTKGKREISDFAHYAILLHYY